MPNYRVFFACQAVAVNNTFVEGAQSVGMTTTFDLEPIFQLGQLDPYDVIPVTPNVEVTISRALVDGGTTLFNGNFATVAANNSTNICLSVGDDTAPVLKSPTFNVFIEEAGLTSVSYKLSTEGAFTEDVTYSANKKKAGGCQVIAPGDALHGISGHVKMRQYYNGGTLPPPLVGQRISSITIGASFSRENLFELGRYEPYYKFVNFPIEVTCEFEVIATDLDSIAVAETATAQCASPQDNPKVAIVINACGNSWDLGDQCRLTSVTYGGGDAGGGNATITYSYSTYNTLTVS